MLTCCGVIIQTRSAVKRKIKEGLATRRGTMFNPLPFEKLNETDVREEVITPLLRRLGYQSGGENNIIREQLLRYPNLSLGRKDPKKDPELRGKADYILEVGTHLRWVIEAKAPEVSIDIDAIEQAWIYANHPEIRAVYFAICNGRELSVFRTAYGPNAEVQLVLPYEEFDSKFQLLSNSLSPDSLVRDFPSMEIDLHPPIAPGLRSIARITNGLIRYEHNSLNVRILNELQIGIADGSVERDESGGLVAFIESIVPSRSLQELNERLGLASFEMVTADTELSGDPEMPTVFNYRNTILIPAGEEVLDFNTWNRVKIPMNITADVSVIARGVYFVRRFSGTFESLIRYPEFAMNLALSGAFEIRLA
jgi:hypothetical protein